LLGRRLADRPRFAAWYLRGAAVLELGCVDCPPFARRLQLARSLWPSLWSAWQLARNKLSIFSSLAWLRYRCTKSIHREAPTPSCGPRAGRHIERAGVCGGLRVCRAESFSQARGSRMQVPGPVASATLGPSLSRCYCAHGVQAKSSRRTTKIAQILRDSQSPINESGCVFLPW
jgi:hypothetical protein